MTNDIIEVIQERLEMLRERELLCYDECRVLRLLVDEIKEQYMKLPLDANGEPIHIGDEVRLNKNGGKFTVRGIGENSAGNPVMWGARELNTQTTRHRIDGEVRLVRPETVENILQDLMNEFYFAENERELISEYAERIKKVVD